MSKRFSFLLIACVFFSLLSQAYAAEITDMTGRTVELPEQIFKVCPDGQSAVVIMHSLSLDMLTSWSFDLLEQEKIYIPSKYHDLPVTGLLSGQKVTGNLEKVMLLKPDIILSAVDLGNAGGHQKMIQDADNLQRKTGIPVVIVTSEIRRAGEVFTFLGKILHLEEKAGHLASYCNRVISYADEQRAKIDVPVTVYYAQGKRGLMTAPKGSSHGEIIELVGGRNVADFKGDIRNRTAVNLEQVLLWNPQVILLADRLYSAFPKTDEPSQVLRDFSPLWERTEAMKNRRVYFVPCKPYNWLDMPPSVNRILGILWLGKKLYPQFYRFDYESEIKDYFGLFYNYEL
ncbi:MAG: ABC transporter substrate-binding protein [Candidatus Riflebacteria bacterium]|nr:ABC transporter substrate-binding protein [Candidatus Riflebacteria bacterium]